MNFITNMFKGLARARVSAVKNRAKAKVRSKTVGRVQKKVMGAQSKLDRKMNNAMDGKGKDGKKAPKEKGAKKGKGAKKEKMAKGKAPKAGKMPKVGGKLRKRKQEAFDDDDFEQEEEDDWAPSASSVPRTRNSRMEEQEEKTVAIDISALQSGEQRELVGWIVALNGSHKGEDFRIFDGKNIIGTAADCHIVITDPYLSSKHCTVRHENGVYTLIDLDSTNGVFVNQVRMSKEELIDNDTIRFGRTEFKFKALV